MLNYINITEEASDQLLDLSEELLIDLAKSPDQDDLHSQLAMCYGLLLRLDLDAVPFNYRFRAPYINQQAYEFLTQNYARRSSDELTYEAINRIEHGEKLFVALKEQYALLAKVSDSEDQSRLYNAIYETGSELVELLISETFSISVDELLSNLIQDSQPTSTQRLVLKSMLSELLTLCEQQAFVFLSHSNELKYIRESLHPSVLETDPLVSKLFKVIDSVEHVALLAENNLLSPEQNESWLLCNQLIQDIYINTTERAHVSAADDGQNLHNFEKDQVRLLDERLLSGFKMTLVEYLKQKDEGYLVRLELLIELQDGASSLDDFTIRPVMADSHQGEALNPFAVETDEQSKSYELTAFTQVAVYIGDEFMNFIYLD